MGTGRRLSGSITVYLALVFVLILSLVAVSLEAAAAATMRSKAEAALASGVESALADYYRPLFDEYGIFALDLGYGEKRANKRELENRISRFAETNSARCTVTLCRVGDTYPIASAGGRYFKEQAIEAEEVTMVEGLIESIGEKLGLIAGQEDVNTVLTRKTELEEELAGVDICTAELMGLIDGVEIDTGLVLEGKGMYRIRNTFVKRFMVAGTDSISAGVNSPKLYAKLKDKYDDPVGKTAELGMLAEEYAELLAAIEAKEAEILPLKEALDEILGQIAVMETEEPAGGTETGDDIMPGPDGDTEYETGDTSVGDPEDSGESEELKSLRSEAEELSGQIRALEAELSGIRAKASAAGRKCEGLAGDLKTLYLETVSCLRQTEETARAAAALSEGLRPKVESFEALLSSMQGVIGEEMLAQLGDSVLMMKEYVGIDSDPAVDFKTIGDTALADRQLLDGNLAVKKLEIPEKTSAAVSKWSRELKVLAERMKAFSYEGMLFDYSSFEAVDAEDLALEGINGFVLEPLSDIWLGFILEDTDGLSEAELKTFLLPQIDGRDGPETGETGTGDSALSTLCGVLKNGIAHIYDKAVFGMYMHDHFNSRERQDRMRATVLKYEQEYLLCGNANDRVNLAGAMAQILLLRMASTGVFAFTNAEISGKAGSAANAVVGFAGLPFLTAALKYLILTVWAFEQAVVETAAIARGKKVPVITNGDSFCIELNELLSFSKELVSRKAGGFREGGPSLSYEEYLYALLLTRSSETLAGRALDLIQENIRYAYGDSFLIGNCVVGFEADAVFSADAAYLTNFPGRGKDRNLGGYCVTVSVHGSY